MRCTAHFGAGRLSQIGRGFAINSHHISSTATTTSSSSRSYSICISSHLPVASNQRSLAGGKALCHRQLTVDSIYSSVLLHTHSLTHSLTACNERPHVFNSSFYTSRFNIRRKSAKLRAQATADSGTKFTNFSRVVIGTELPRATYNMRI